MLPVSTLCILITHSPEGVQRSYFHIRMSTHVAWSTSKISQIHTPENDLEFFNNIALGSYINTRFDLPLVKSPWKMFEIHTGVLEFLKGFFFQ